ncbi:MAG: hypothetical protein IKE70_05145, partial [Bacilli bacterium]|nr:hypothetical protein [Bacilli bacterium]
IYEFNMDYYMNLWYTQNKEEIKENKLFIMMDLELKELASISIDDKVVSKYMIELERINKDPRFVHFMSLEEDRKKRENTRIEIAKEIGLERGITLGREKNNLDVAKKMLEKNIPKEDISEITGLSEEEIISLSQ